MEISLHFNIIYLKGWIFDYKMSVSCLRVEFRVSFRSTDVIIFPFTIFPNFSFTIYIYLRLGLYCDFCQMLHQWNRFFTLLYLLLYVQYPKLRFRRYFLAPNSTFLSLVLQEKSLSCSKLDVSIFEGHYWRLRFHNQRKLSKILLSTIL